MLRAPSRYTANSSISELLVGIAEKDQSAMDNLLSSLEPYDLMGNAQVQRCLDEGLRLLKETEHDAGGWLHTLVGACYYRLNTRYSSNYANALIYLGGGHAHKNTEAMAFIGEMNAYPNYNLHSNSTEAVSWYCKAAAAGNPFAMSQLGWKYQNGYGVERSDEQAVSWYRKAAEAGNLLGMYNLGVMYSNGRGIAKNNVESARWHTRAAEAGHPTSMYYLGYLYQNGFGVAQNKTEAAHQYRNAARGYNRLRGTTSSYPISYLQELFPLAAARYYDLTLTQPLPYDKIIKLAVATKDVDILDLFYRDEVITEQDKLNLALTITADQLQSFPQHQQSIYHLLIAEIGKLRAAQPLSEARELKIQPYLQKLDELITAQEKVTPAPLAITELRLQLSLLRAQPFAEQGQVAATYAALGTVNHPKACAVFAQALFHSQELFESLHTPKDSATPEYKYIVIAHLLEQVPAEVRNTLHLILNDQKVIAARQLNLTTEQHSMLLNTLLHEIKTPEANVLSRHIEESLAQAPFANPEQTPENILQLWLQLKLNCSQAKDLLQERIHAVKGKDEKEYSERLEQLKQVRGLTQDCKQALRNVVTLLEKRVTSTEPQALKNEAQELKAAQQYCDQVKQNIASAEPLTARLLGAMSSGLTLFAPKSSASGSAAKAAVTPPMTHATALAQLRTTLQAWLDEVRTSATPAPATVPALVPPAPMSSAAREASRNELERTLNTL
jgi:TPR repeat protein